MSLNCFQSSDIFFLYLILHVTGMKSGCKIKWALLPIPVPGIHKTIILLIRGIKNLDNILTCGENTTTLMIII